MSQPNRETVHLGTSSIVRRLDDLPDTVVNVDSPPADGQVGVWNATTRTWQPANPGGSGSSGVAVHRFPFAFDTPDILTGATAVFTDGYTITAGDALLDAWVEIDTAWDGTTPKGDYAIVWHSNTGWLGWDGPAPMDMTHSDATTNPGALGGTKANTLLTSLMFAAGNSFRSLPTRFLTGDPITVVVSQDGTNVGADPASTQGSATLYVMTAPV